MNISSVGFDSQYSAVAARPAMQAAVQQVAVSPEEQSETPEQRAQESGPVGGTINIYA